MERWTKTVVKQILCGDTDGEPAMRKIKSESEALAVANTMFHNVAQQGAEYIFLADLNRVMPEDESLKVLNFFEGASETGKISKSALQDWVVNDFIERKAFVSTLMDTKKAADDFKRILNCIGVFLTVILFLFIFEVVTTATLILIVILFGFLMFLFRNYWKTIFESIVFVFTKCPFHVGDRCYIDGVELVVEQIELTSTTFLTVDNSWTTISNSELAKKMIINDNRGAYPREVIEFSISMSTPADKIVIIQQEIERYVEVKKEHWRFAPEFTLKDVEGDKLKFVVQLTHTINHEDTEERRKRRSLLLKELFKILCVHNIQHSLQLPTVQETAAALSPSPSDHSVYYSPSPSTGPYQPPRHRTKSADQLEP